jgi:hypothetical protein
MSITNVVLASLYSAIHSFIIRTSRAQNMATMHLIPRDGKIFVFVLTKHKYVSYVQGSCEEC